MAVDLHPHSLNTACKSITRVLETIGISMVARNQREVADLDIIISDYEQIAPTEDIDNVVFCYTRIDH